MGVPGDSLLRHRDFLKLWSAETISLFGTQVTLLALPLIAATTLEVTPFEFGLLGTIEFLPFVLLSLPAGVWVDRMRRRPILIVGDLGRGLALITIPVAFWLDALTIWQLYVVGFVNGCLTVFFDVAYQSYVPSLVERRQLVDANGKLEISRSSAQVIGPGLSGVLIGLLRAPIAILLDALSFLGSALFVLWIRREEPAPEVIRDEQTGRRPSMRSDIASGMRYVLGHRWLRPIAATTGISNLFGSMGLGILILYLVRERGLAAEVIGFAFSLGATGVLAAAITAAPLARRLGVGRTLLLSSLGFSVSLLPVALAPDALVFAGVAMSGFLGGYCGVSWNITQVSLRQAITPTRMLGRMNATIRFIIWGTIPVGTIAAGFLGGVIGLHPTIWVAALGSLAGFVPVVLSSVRELREMPEPIEETSPAESAAIA